MKDEQDFIFVRDLFRDFVKKANVQKVIQESQNKIELWIQTEFEMFVKENSDAEIYREHPISLDNRVKSDKSTSFFDFKLRRKGYAKDKFILVELKYEDSYKTCIKKMIEDSNKYYQLKPSDSNLVRCFVLVGIHKHKEDSKTVYRDYFETLDINSKLETTFFETFVIPNTDYCFSIFNAYRD